jgi:hypothetical protein
MVLVKPVQVLSSSTTQNPKFGCQLHIAHASDNDGTILFSAPYMAMRKRNYGNHHNGSNCDDDDDGVDCEPQRQSYSSEERKRRHKQQLKQTLRSHRRSGSACFLLGVVCFCLLQAVTFLVVDKVGSVGEDDDGDDRSMFGWPNLFAMVWSYFTDKGPMYHVFSPGYHQQDQQPILLIGGSDGSGTRAFVDTLRELGAVVVADDKQSFDVHAVELFQHQGWPGLINAVINFTHTGDYEWEDLIRLSSKIHADHVRREITSLMRSLQSKYDISKRHFRQAYQERLEIDGVYEPVRALREHKHPTRKGKKPFSASHPPGVAMAGMKPTLFPAVAKSISYVVKAPVSMLVLPLLAKFYGNYYNGGHIKFLHVIRE